MSSRSPVASLPRAALPTKTRGADTVDEAIEIRHVDLKTLPERLSGKPTNVLLVFWLEQRPVGQFYTRLPIEGIVATELVKRGVDPAATQTSARLALADDSLRASVVICTRNRPDELARCLKSLAGQTRPVHEIIVVDNGSGDDRTRTVAESSGARYIREDRMGLDIARNTGARASTGDVVVYTDDDVELHPAWLERLVAAFEPGVHAVTGLVLPADLTTRAQQIFERHWGFGRGFQRIDFGRAFYGDGRSASCPVWKIGAGASMGFRREVFDRVGYFDERLDAGAAGCSGDSEFWHRLLAAGSTIRYEPASVAFHQHRRELAGLKQQIFAYARGHTAALLVQYERTGNRAHLRRAFWDLPLYYLRRYVRKPLGNRSDADRYLFAELRGWWSGIVFYYRTPRPARS